MFGGCGATGCDAAAACSGVCWLLLPEPDCVEAGAVAEPLGFLLILFHMPQNVRYRRYLVTLLIDAEKLRRLYQDPTVFQKLGCFNH